MFCVYMLSFSKTAYLKRQSCVLVFAKQLVLQVESIAITRKLYYNNKHENPIIMIVQLRSPCAINETKNMSWHVYTLYCIDVFSHQ